MPCNMPPFFWQIIRANFHCTHLSMWSTRMDKLEVHPLNDQAKVVSTLLTSNFTFSSAIFIQISGIYKRWVKHTFFSHQLIVRYNGSNCFLLHKPISLFHHPLTARYCLSLSIKSASLLRSRPRSDASIVLHGDPALNASLAAFTALSTSACKKDFIKWKA